MSVLKHIKLGFNNLLFWLEKHQIGILTTIAVHLFIITIILILKINTYAERDYNIIIDLSQIETIEEKSQQQENTQEFIQNMRQEYNIHTIPVNVAPNRAVENIDKMVRDIKTEMNITDPKPSQEKAEEITLQEDKLLENEARIYEDKFPLDEAGKRTVYKGTTTVSYELSGRRHVSMPAPVYKCRGGGKIVVDIVVSNRGYVLSADINKANSDSEDPCLVNAARRDAERSRFDAPPTAAVKQYGNITYIFLPQ